MRPGKPKTSNVTSESLILSWERPETFQDGDYYQVSYKDLDSGGKWKFLPGEYTTSTAEIVDLKSNTNFSFRVRVVHEQGEGPYSPESEICWTTDSPASRIVPFATNIEGCTPRRFALPTTELKNARNENAKTRKFDIGSPSPSKTKEKTIMLLGATGTGKSTLVDGIVNYVLGVTWSDPFRFSMVDLEQEEKERVKKQAGSHTEYITCYTIHPEKGSRLNYRLNIIDTPGFGDTIAEQIRQLFSEHESVVCIDAVCFLIKAPDARLTPVQKYIFQSVMSMFGKDIENNICYLITFADGLDPPVLAALKESGLPFGKHFIFNNSGLFAKNVGISSSSLSPMFWDMGMKSFRAFFIHLDSTQTGSLQLTKAVLDERFRLEATVNNLQPRLAVGLAKVDQLKQEIKILDDIKSLIKNNKNFEYEVEETRQIKTELKAGVHVTYCTHCHFTCHDNCEYGNDDEKAKCTAMDFNGNCKVCPFMCHWKKHANTPYVFKYVQVKVKKNYIEMQKNYKEATDKLLSQEQLLQKMGNELIKISKDIESLMEIVKTCNERLNEIALRPNPLTMTEHIDLMISMETMEKKSGFEKRIHTLNLFRKRAAVTRVITNFSETASSTLEEIRRSKKKRDMAVLFSKLKNWIQF